MINNFAEIGYPKAKHYTDPDMKVDFAVFDNEDIGFTAALAADDTYEFALPYPADVSLDEEALIIHWIDFFIQRNDAIDLNGNLTIEALDIFFSMLNVDFDTTNPANQLDDTNNLEVKKTFDGPYHLRCETALLEDDNGTPASHAIVNTEDIAWGARLYRYIPMHKLDLPLPLFIQLVNRSLTFTTLDLVTAATDAAFAAASTEFFNMRIWYTKRKLTATEKAVRGQAKFMRLAS